jgi:hypothetical protein
LAQAETFEIDLIAETDEDAEIRIYAGEAVLDGVITEHLVVCIEYYYPSEDMVLGPYVVSFIESEETGNSANLNPSEISEEEVTDQVNIFVENSDFVFNSNPDGIVCSDLNADGLSESELIEVNLIPTTRNIEVFNASNFAINSIRATGTTCDLTEDEGDDYWYGRLYYDHPVWGWIYNGEFAVCDSSSRLCVYDDDVIDDTGEYVNI